MKNIIETYCNFWDTIAGYPLDYLQVFVLSIMAIILVAAIAAFFLLPMRIGGMEGHFLMILWKFIWSILQSLIMTVISSAKLFWKNFKFFWDNEKKGKWQSGRKTKKKNKSKSADAL